MPQLHKGQAAHEMTSKSISQMSVLGEAGRNSMSSENRKVFLKSTESLFEASEGVTPFIALFPLAKHDPVKSVR